MESEIIFPPRAFLYHGYVKPVSSYLKRPIITIRNNARLMNKDIFLGRTILGRRCNKAKAFAIRKPLDCSCRLGRHDGYLLPWCLNAS
jgi:hypothetical protein